jgi:hypothetical protein
MLRAVNSLGESDPANGIHANKRLDMANNRCQTLCGESLRPLNSL